MMVVDSTGLTGTMADREWPPCLASGTIGKGSDGNFFRTSRLAISDPDECFATARALAPIGPGP